MDGKRLPILLLTILLFSLAFPASASALPVGVAAPSAKIQSYLATLAATDPDESVAVIVQKVGQSTAAEAIIVAAGGQVTKELSLIDSFAAHVPARAIVTLAASPAVKWVALDAPVMTASDRGPTISDDFTTVAYSGNNSAYLWAADWQEVGEADGAVVGDVAVTPFWGGALQGLRLQGVGKGAWRSVNLAETTSATLHLAYRRKAFGNEQDFVTIELSRDGGATWQAIDRLAGPVTDAEIQYASYDLTDYRTAATAIRLTTAATFSEPARFYLDMITVDFATDAAMQLAAVKSVYLPLVTTGTEHSVDNDGAALSKAEQVARMGEDSRDVCNYYCIDLDKLNSTFVKAIRADQLWNVPPYLRGWNVKIAVVDSGITTNRDLYDYSGANRVIQQVNFVPGSYTPDDYFGHGSHIGGIAAALGDNAGRVYMGVAPEARLIDVRVMNDRGHGNTSNVVQGLQWIYNNRSTHGIRIVNLSLNSRIPESYHKSALNAALEILWFNGITVVVSAGNGGKQRLYPPANDPFVITVGAADDKGTVSTTDDTLASFSAYGMTSDGFLKPDLVAPGTNITSILASDDSNLVTAYPGSVVLAPNTARYFRMSGTSMAAAVVSGAIAVLLEDEPNLTPDQIKFRLRATARPFTGTESCSTGAGYLDLYAAVNGTTTQSANTGTAASQRLWTGSQPLTWGSVSWNSVSWNSVSWNTVSWNTVSWNTLNWNSVSWNTADTDGGLSSGSCGSAISGLTLVNANTDQDIQPLFDGAVINLDAIGTTNLTVRADVVGTVASVKFDLSGSSTTSKIENAVPYALVGDTNGNYAPYTLGTGNYRLKVQSYAAANATGTAGGVMDIEFVVASASRCNVENIARPKSSNRPVSFQVRNNGTVQLEMFLLTATGTRSSYGVIPPGQTKVYSTFDTHPWVIARDSDNLCLRLIPNAGNEPDVVYP